MLIFNNIMSSIKRQKNIFSKKNSEEQINIFNSLTPTNKVKDKQIYFDALNWALNNPDIKNIAITGPYGSGKSSILRTFEFINKNRKNVFLNISLATFKEETKDKHKIKGENLLRLIELSILQQLFYREKDKQLPDSRLKKIKNLTTRKSLFISFTCMLFIFSIIYLTAPQFISTIFRCQEVVENNWLYILSLLSCVATIGYVIFKSVRIFHNLKISKLSINNAEIEIDSKINKSVLNHNLEEILYFFERTKYNIIVIEDLDRFQEIDIFTKLREINLLINNSKKINKRVIFIYAIRDDMFINKTDRTKFFDFIIPVIPFINSSNSHEILKKELNAIAKVSDTLIEDISLFIDEMRILFNVINEFKIYKHILSKTDELDTNKLLAMIAYKNLCPDDFVELSNYEGELYEIINSKHDYIKNQISVINDRIKKIKIEIDEIEKLRLKDIKELRNLYILQYIKKAVDKNSNGFRYFEINSKQCNNDDLHNDDNFSYLINNATIYYRSYNNYNYIQSININFSDIEKQVDPNQTYSERENFIKQNNSESIQKLKKQIAMLENKKSKLRQEKISNLLINENISVEINNNKQKLIYLMLQNGYIDENYFDYISLFHEGSLSKNDHTFLLNSRSQIRTDFNQKLYKLENLIKKIPIENFGKEPVLNFSLFEFILSNKEYVQQRELFFNLLKSENDYVNKFLLEFENICTCVDCFIIESYTHKIDLFDTLYKNKLPADKLSSYLKSVIENVSTEILKNITEDSFLFQAIIENPDEKYNIFDMNINEKKITDLIKSFNIKFKCHFKSENLSEGMFEYIYQNNHYIIGDYFLRLILKRKQVYNHNTFETQNFYAIKSSSCDSLFKYLLNNITIYLNNVYLQLEENVNEDEQCFIDLLNIENLDLKLKTAIIQKVKTQIADLSKVNSIQIRNLLISHSKITPCWKQLISNYTDNEEVLCEHILGFLNNKENATILSKIRIDINVGVDEIETIKNFLSAILLNNKINLDSYSLILKSVPYIYQSLHYEDLPKDYVLLLVNNRRLSLNKENFTKLKGTFPNLHIVLIEVHQNELSDIIENLSFDDDDINAMLLSDVLTIENKQMMINKLSEEIFINNTKLLTCVEVLLYGNNLIEIPINILKSILIHNSQQVERNTELFNKTARFLNKSDIIEIISTFPVPYPKILNKGRPLIPYTETNNAFVKLLKDKDVIKNYLIENKGIRIISYQKGLK